MIEAKVFKSGNSQAIRLPKEYRINSDSVRINKIGNLLIILPPNDPWSNFIEGINEASDFPEVTDAELKLKKVDVE